VQQYASGAGIAGGGCRFEDLLLLNPTFEILIAGWVR
jgi:hypothetical protein